MKTAALFLSAAALGLFPLLADAQPRTGVGETRVKPLPRPESPALAPTPLRRTHAAPEQPFAPFTVTKVTVKGSSAPPGMLDAATRPFVGQTLREGGLKQITDAVARLYDDSDVALYTVAAPSQDFAGGEVRLVVLEGHIAEVVIHALPEGQDLSLVKGYGQRLTAERPLLKPTLERYISLIRDIPGLTVGMDLLQTDVPGAVRLGLELRQKRFDGGFSLNTRGTALLGRTQVAFDGYWNGMLAQGDQAHITLAAPTDLRRFQYYAGSYERPLGTNGARAAVSAAYLKTRPKGSPIDGEAKLAGVQVSHPVIRSYRQDLYVSGGLDMLNSENALFGRAFSDERTRAVRLAAAWSKTGKRTVTGARGALGLGIDGLGARTRDPRLADADFRKLGVAASQDRVLTPTLALRLRAAGQATDDRLPASEQFSLGGDEYGRAFESSALVGDYGYAASGELAWTPASLPKTVAGSELYGFVDGGRVWARGRLGMPGADAALASAGGGVRLAVAQKAVIGVEGARAVDSPPGRDDEWRMVFSLRTLID